MEEFEITEPKPKRMRINPVKKWTIEEERALIRFMLQNRDFEKPTAQVYYSRFAEVSNIAAGWKVMRSKVRNMRTSYKKAKDWEGSTGAFEMEEETLKTNLLRMCHFFYAFDELFGGRQEENTCMEESLYSSSSNDIFNTAELKSEEVCFEFQSLPSTSHKGMHLKTANSEITQFQVEMLSLQKQKIEQELNLKEREVAIKEGELKLKEKELNEFKEFREKELQSQEKIKILELEMKERLAMEELKLKYK